jgi:hypothetical protein
MVFLDSYKKKFDSYPNDILEFAKQNQITLPKISTLKGQALCLMSQNEIKGKIHITPEQATLFFKNVGIKSRDAIQAFRYDTYCKKKKSSKNSK